MASRETTGRPSISATPAHQGRWARWGRQVFWVLLISTIAAAIALMAAWVWRADEPASVQAMNDGAVAPSHVVNAPDPASATRQ
jgi:hypothetical protein